jgi:gamma-D-glutamyl-L-lysine dipeptidyl-peptidase
MNKFLFILLMLMFCFRGFAESKQVKAANRVVHSVCVRYAPDKRTAICDLQINEYDGKLTIRGKMNTPEAKKMLMDSLSSLKINMIDSVLVLPERRLGEKVWGIVKLSVANMRSVPAHSGELASQLLMGTPVKIWDENEDWLQVQSPDQYIGWVDKGAIVRKSESEMTDWKRSNRYVFNKLTGFALDAPNKNAGHVSDLVLCDLFEVISETKGYFKVCFPDRRNAFVRKNECLSFHDWTNHSFDVEQVLSVARQMTGVPYFWGGTSSKATDCSGLSKTSYFSQGIVLARDASQQVHYGAHPDFSDYRNLQAGDLIFFGNSAHRVTHVAIYLGNGRFIHASGSSAMVRLNSMIPADSLFDDGLVKRIVGASRIVGSFDTEGIFTVKNHPWYSIVNNN